MKIADIVKYGIFDTDVAFPGQKLTRERVADCFEIEFMISCNGTTVLDGEPHELMPGTVIVVRPGRRRMSYLGFKCYCLHLSPDSLPKEYADLLTSAPPILTLVDSTAYRSLFELLIRHLITEDDGGESDYTSAKLLELFYMLRRDAPRNLTLPVGISQKANAAISRAIEYIEENPSGDLSLRRLAAAADYSPSRFHRLFCDTMGVTPQKYLMDVRVRRAKYMLARPELSLSEIAYACGFSSQAYFGAVFRRHTSLTPGEYRRLCMYNYSE